MNEELNREVILQHYSNPSNYGKGLDDSYDIVKKKNDTCIDDVTYYIKIENGIIKDIKFDGEACAISIASSSIASENLIGKSISDALLYINQFSNMIDNKNYDEDILSDANAFCNIYKQNNRKNCAYLPYGALKNYLENYKS